MALYDVQFSRCAECRALGQNCEHYYAWGLQTEREALINVMGNLHALHSSLRTLVGISSSETTAEAKLALVDATIRLMKRLASVTVPDSSRLVQTASECVTRMEAELNELCNQPQSGQSEGGEKP